MNERRGRFTPPPKKETVRVNDRIRKSPVRLIDADGTQVGIVTLDDARRRAEEQNLDLVEVGATADPPVVKILDWGKTRFEKEKRAREAKKKATTIDIKEIKFRPTIGDNDFLIKTKRTIGFLKQGKKVKVSVFFRLRQLRRPELGDKILDHVVEMITQEGVGEVESRAKLEGRQIVMVLTPASQKPSK